MSKHAEIHVGEYTIPLIGIHPSSVEERCDFCKRIFQFQSIELRDRNFGCFECWGIKGRSARVIKKAGEPPGGFGAQAKLT